MNVILRLLLLLAACLPIAAIAQYVPHSGQPFHYAPIYNPAFTGIDNFIDIKVGHRYQWGGFNDNAPQFSNFIVNFRTKHPLDLKVNALRPSRTDFSRIIPKSRLNFHGLGGNVYNEQFGPLHKYGAGLHYAVHMPITEKTFVSGGVGAMYENSQLRGGDELFWGDNVNTNDPIYQILQAGNISQSSIWTRAGLLVYSDKFYMGATYYPWNTKVGDPDLAFDDQFYSGSMQAGFSFFISDEIELKPSILALWRVDDTFMIDYHAKAYLQDKAWFGLTYRDIKTSVVSAGFNFNSTFSIGYSYEFSLGKLRTFAGSSHELILLARFRNFKQANQRTW